MRLENFIKENYEKFNSEEPAEGHFNRLEEHLQSIRQVQKPKFELKRVWWIAAVFCGLVVCGSLFFHFSKPQPHQCALSAEVENMRSHYESVMEGEIHNLKVILDDANPAIREKVLNDALQMKADTKDLPTDFCDGSNNKKAVEVIVKHYESKIKALQSITLFMKENKNNI